MNADEHRYDLEKGKVKGENGPLPCDAVQRGRFSSFPFSFFPFLLLSAFFCVHLPLLLVYAQGRVVDRIVATIEGEPVTASELADLGRFQQLSGGAVATDKELLRRRIEQWIIAADARNSRFPRPASADVDRELARLTSQFPSPEAYAARLRELGLRAESVRGLLEQQLWLARYVDARFRPTAQVDEQQIAAYYNGDLTRELKTRGQSVPPLDTVREQIRELLTQREISERAGRWLDENRARIRVVPHGATESK